jgi:hypothetical protein
VKCEINNHQYLKMIEMFATRYTNASESSIRIVDSTHNSLVSKVIRATSNSADLNTPQDPLANALPVSMQGGLRISSSVNYFASCYFGRHY